MVRTRNADVFRSLILFEGIGAFFIKHVLLHSIVRYFYKIPAKVLRTTMSAKLRSNDQKQGPGSHLKNIIHQGTPSEGARKMSLTHSCPR